MSTYVADSSAWLAYLDAEASFKQLIETNDIETPASAVAEINKSLIKRQYPDSVRKEALELIFRNSIILPLDFEYALKAGELSAKERLHFADALIYAFASAEKPLLTKDSHFKGKKFVEFVE